VEECLVTAEVDDAGKPRLAKPTGNFVKSVAREVPGCIPVESVADANFGIGMHRNSDCQNVQDYPDSPDNPAPACEKTSLEAADRGRQTAQEFEEPNRQTCGDRPLDLHHSLDERPFPLIDPDNEPAPRLEQPG
jgi:hypothetical protein